MGPRIAIIGNAGGGKSTLARRLGQLLDLPVTHVDSVQYQSGWQRSDNGECDSILEAVANNGRWIIDGFGNNDVIEQRIAVADTVIHIDFPIWRHYCWAAKRQLKSRHGQRSELPTDCPEFTLTYTRHLFAMMWLVHREYTPWFRSLVRQKAIAGQGPRDSSPTAMESACACRQV